MPVTAVLQPSSGSEPHNQWVVEVSPDDDERYRDDLSETLSSIAEHGGGQAQVWVQSVSETTDQHVRSLGAVAYRDLWQLRCPLPAAPSSIETRPFTPEDAEALVGVNNRAFSWHPEQSGMTTESLAKTMAEPWFNADGLRLFERDGELLGFCWTKVHADMEPVHGEIFVIGLDPSAHGQGLGTPMTLAGLDWIAAQGIEHALLYVESDNDAANATYRKIGFELHQVNRAYTMTIDAA